MHPAAQNATTGAFSQSAALADEDPSSQASPRGAEPPVQWSQRQVIGFPPEVLTHIFRYLGSEDIVRVHNTCQRFRTVVREHQKHLLLFSRFPLLFRRRYLQSLSWQKWVVQNGLHPFIDRLPDAKNQVVHHEEQQAAVLCLRTLENMRSTPGYTSEEVFSVGPTPLDWQLSPSSSNVLIYFPGDRLSLADQKVTGSWKNHRYHFTHPKTMKNPRLFFSPDGEYLSVFGFNNQISVLKRAAGWEAPHHFNCCLPERVNDFTISASGQYELSFTETGGIDHICRFNKDTERWGIVRLVRSIDFKEGPIQWATFSPAERHLVVEYAKKLVMISRDDLGSWIPLWETPTNGTISYTEFSPSGRWLLVACRTSEQDGSVAMIRLDPAGQRLQEQVIAERYLKLTFSPSGSYLVSQKGEAEYLLWRLSKSGQWQFYGDLTSSEAPLWPELGPMNLKPDTLAFSPCDNYLLTSTRDGMVHFWGRDEQENWTLRGSLQHYEEVRVVGFSQSGVHALSVDSALIRIWRCDDDGFWSVKGSFRATHVKRAHFHPAAEHLIVFENLSSVRIRELRKNYVSFIPSSICSTPACMHY